MNHYLHRIIQQVHTGEHFVFAIGICSRKAQNEAGATYHSHCEHYA